MTSIFKVDQTKDLVNVDDDSFATLSDIQNNKDVVFEFRYVVDQVEMIKRNLKTVVIVVSRGSVAKQDTTASSNKGSSLQGKNLIDDTLRGSQLRKQISKRKQQDVVARKHSDVSSRISNQLVSLTRIGNFDAENSNIKTKLVVDVVTDVQGTNISKPLLQTIAHSNVTDLALNLSSSIELNEQDVMLSLVTLQGIDPSSLAGLTHRSVDAQRSWDGTLRKTKSREGEFSLESLLLNKRLFGAGFLPPGATTAQLPVGTSFSTFQQVSDNKIEIREFVKIPGRVVKTLKEGVLLDVSFDLVDPVSNVVVCSVTKKLDVVKHIKFRKLPKRPPIVSYALTDMISKISMQLRQDDPGGRFIDVFKKTINIHSVSNDDYKLVETVPVSFGRSVNVDVDKAESSTVIYRFVPVGERGTTCAEFSSIVVRPERFVQDRSVSLVTRSVQTGIEIEARSFPPGIVSFEILHKDLSRFQDEFNVVGQDVIVSDSIKSGGTFSVIDTNAKIDHVHEYKLRMHFRSGVPQYSQSSFIERFAIERGKVDINVTDLVVVNDVSTLNVIFNVDVQTIDGDTDLLKSLLRKQGVENLFQVSLEDERSFLKELITCNVQRLNLTLGEREDFGVVIPGTFNDSVEGAKNSVKPLQRGYTYQYEVHALMRPAESLMQAFVKNVVDPLTKKKFKFKPQKSFHPLALVDGIVTTRAGLDFRSKNSFMHGRVGSYFVVNVSFDDNKAEIGNIQAERFDSRFNEVSWDMVPPSPQIVDHFLIMKDVHGVRTMVGKCHGQFSLGRYKFFHQIGDHDRGELKYVVVLIRNDYTVGNEVTSNSVVID